MLVELNMDFGSSGTKAGPYFKLCELVWLSAFLWKMLAIGFPSNLRSHIPDQSQTENNKTNVLGLYHDILG